MTAYWCERAWLPDGVHDHVLLHCDSSGTLVSVESEVDSDGDAIVLPGLTFPGFANGHSHAFHRALRGRTHAGGGTFWTWREAMYAEAARLDPDSYRELATRVYTEMLLAGYTAVGEFHYLHHAPGGARYADPNAMGEALIAAARDAGIRLTLLDTCYLTGGIGAPLSPPQLRFGDGDADAWAARVDELAARYAGAPDVRIGAAIHSVRAVPDTAIAPIALWAKENNAPLHVHLSEQPAENEACHAAYRRTPTELLHQHGALTEHTTAVHATHLTNTDIGLLGAARATACFCPTTEADLADGIGPARELADAGAVLALGSDQHAVIDPFVEARSLEYGERLRAGRRGRFTPAELVTSATAAGHAALGRPGAGCLVVGAPADLVAVRLDTPRTAGVRPDQAILAAGAADVHTVVVGGRTVITDGRHALWPAPSSPASAN
ncbi:MAG TPA: formimidoylglutamate deiminase [Pseudonocardiaceae bacterium]|nr:formimidoylglutamate deiminase [Pseudonocardiaceae bacterium]